jgi:hypothetical protein
MSTMVEISNSKKIFFGRFEKKTSEPWYTTSHEMVHYFGLTFFKFKQGYKDGARHVRTYMSFSVLNFECKSLTGIIVCHETVLGVWLHRVKLLVKM